MKIERSLNWIVYCISICKRWIMRVLWVNYKCLILVNKNNEFFSDIFSFLFSIMWQYVYVCMWRRWLSLSLKLALFSTHTLAFFSESLFFLCIFDEKQKKTWFIQKSISFDFRFFFQWLLHRGKKWEKKKVSS